MKFNSIVSLAVAVTTAAALMTSCNSEYPGFKKTESGIYYKIYNSDNNDTAEVRAGSIVTMSLSYGLKDSVVFDSKMMPEPIVMSMMDPQYPGDFFEAFQLFRQGDSATFILKAGPFFTKTVGQPAVPEFATEETDMYFHVKLTKVQSQEQAEADRLARNEEMRQMETFNLQQYVAQNNISVSPSATGVYYIETKKGSGKSPEKEQYVTAHFTVYLLGNPNKLFSTYDRGEPIDFKFGSPFENEGFQEVIGQMKEGGKADAIVPSSMAFGERGAGEIVPPFSTLYYNVELVDVMTTQEWDKKQADATAKKEAENAKKAKEEEGLIQKYLKDNNIVPTTVLPNGLIYFEKQAGTGNSPVEGKKVKVHYTGRLVDGTVFDSSVDRGEPLEFVIGRGGVIQGWDTGIPLMKVGGKAILIIPSKIGYGERGMGNQIPPFSTLVFDVELVEAEQ
jgi:peptidylprolyl isomerase